MEKRKEKSEYLPDEFVELMETLEKLEEENKELYNKRMGVCDRVYELEEENKKLKEERDFFYKSAKQFREQVEKWEKDFVEGRIVEKD